MISIYVMYLQDQVFDASFLHLVKQASIPAKIVLLILLVFSVISWAIIFLKQRFIHRVNRQSQDFLRLFRRCRRWVDAYAFCDQFRDSPLVNLFLAAYDQVSKNAHPNPGLAEARPSLVHIERELQRASLIETERFESYLSWLASIATSSPFIGLFGTVVGIIISFQGLSTQTQTSIQAVAPGIAEALVATAAGLFVAVPAYIAYNQYVAQLRRFVSALDEFSLEILNAIDGSVLEHGNVRS